ncbi:GerAB/ArcD/ProY family transporter [Ureibacillus chungkukjangi]|uniref:Spore germination protein (Amino acid permease) n=1 Tax=Ureibacillus chungkukjangi TaxID=1202712 RepID=A0A318TKW7_9BACL|nr:GerAB/ArcD/ProY family transporter [Ureibacillus chungkukjangi]PYF02475.1 spore germination protein (amino acid permease) [Ureibacillus chungkukjangi]
MKVQITNGMFMAIIINAVYAKAIGLTQGTMAREIGNDIWISTIIATLLSVLLIWSIVVIIKRFPSGDIMDQSKVLLGGWFSKFISLLLFFFFLCSYGVIMITYVYHLMDYFLPEAPAYIFIIIAFIVGCYGAYFGIEVIGRMALIGVFSVLALNILLMLGSLSKFDVYELLPTFQDGITSTIWASRHHVADWAMVAMTVAVILPYVRNPQEWTRSSTAGFLFGGTFIVMWPILEVGVLSSEVTGQYIVSCMQMARSAKIGQFIHRYEMIMIAFFAISILTQIMMCFLCASTVASKIFGLKDYRRMILPVALILSGFGFWIVYDHHRAMELLETAWVYVSLSIAIFITLLLLILGSFMKKKLETKNKENVEHGTGSNNNKKTSSSSGSGNSSNSGNAQTE